ncbi:MAG: tetratricopeptide repeat protein [Planctomycetes bacterium]|nr:tetratricopeptide repeat protein [Planctomycetota bacterium]
MSGEEHYLFRHALMRDVAYLLHPVTLRGTLHRIALELTEAEIHGSLPEASSRLTTDPHPVDGMAAGLAYHARFAQDEPYADLEGLRRRERNYLVIAGNHAERTFDNAAAIDAWRRLVDLAPAPARFWVLHRLARALRAADQVEDAERAAREAVDSFGDDSDHEQRAIGLGELGLVLWLRGADAQALEVLQEALVEARDVGDRMEGNSIGMLAMVYEQMHRLPEAEEHYDNAIAMLRAAGDQRNEGVFLGNLAGLYIEQGRHEPARKLLLESLKVSRAVGDRLTEGINLANLGALYAELGQHQEALDCLEPAMRIHREVGNRRSTGMALEYRSMARKSAADFAGAREDLLRALAIHREVGNRRSEASTLAQLAIVELKLDATADAAEHWLCGSGVLRGLGDTALETEYRAEMLEACKEAGVPPLDSAAGFHQPAGPDDR